MEALRRMQEHWDAVVNQWLEGGPAVTQETRPWLRAYRGTGRGEVVPDALPEPWFGNISDPAVVFLALNPGAPFLGSGQTWRDGTQMPDLQSRDGVFANEIRRAGSYSAWARRVPDWSRWAPTPNTFFASRERFMRDWLGSGSLTLDDAANVELYPWHSVSFSAGAFKPERHARELVDRYVLDPVAAAGCPYVFAFGKAWFDILVALRFEAVFTLSTEAGDIWASMPKHRVITVYRRKGLTVVAERHMGGAGPPKTAEVAPLRQRLMPFLTDRD